MVQRIPFLHQELALGKKFSKCYNYGGTAFFAQATPGGWGGYAIFFHARNFFPPPHILHVWEGAGHLLCFLGGWFVRLR